MSFCCLPLQKYDNLTRKALLFVHFDFVICLLLTIVCFNSVLYFHFVSVIVLIAYKLVLSLKRIIKT